MAAQARSSVYICQNAKLLEITCHGSFLLQFTVKDLFKNPDLKKPLIISLVMHLSQQLSGINAVST